uniref:Uncharacterized protein n=1 Tax=Varanus komodoensis TaxID=61221 RepID=A0A8D2KVF3_VARKO
MLWEMKLVEKSMLRLLLVVDCDLTEDFNSTVPPRRPQEYWKQVQIEAAKCSDIVVKQFVNVSLSGCHLAPEGYVPALKWQQQQVVHFSAVHQSMNKHRNHWKLQHLDNSF